MLVIKDFATTILASALTAAATSVVVSDASRLPALSAGDYYYLVLQKFTDRTSVEVVKVTGATGNTLTVVRAQAGTTAKSFAIGDYAEQRVTVGTFSEYIAQSVAGKVDKSGAVVEQSLGLLNTGDLVKATVGVSYDATNGHGTILSGGEGANKVTPYVALRPLGVADSSVQLKYAQDGSLILSGGSRYVETGLLSMKHPQDANGWPNAINSDANNYNSRARGKVHVNNNALYFIADGAFNARRFGIQSGHEDPGYATAYGILDLNPFGGAVRVNGGTVYHTNYVPTPAAVGALPLAGGILTGPLDQNMDGYGARLVADSGYVYLQGGKVGDTSDHKMVISGIGGSFLASLDIRTATHGLVTIKGARIYTEQYVPTPDVLGAVPQARTINSKPLTSNITLSAADVGALPSSSYKPRADSLNNSAGQIGVVEAGDMDTRPAGDFALFNGKTVNNSPHNTTYFYCETKSIYSIGALLQTAWPYDGLGGVYHRNYSLNTHSWTPWQRVYDTKNKPTAADVGALPIAGGSLGGSVFVHPSAPIATVTGLTAAPLTRQFENVEVASSFIPFGHMSARSAYGYVTHINFGLYKRAVPSWDGSGMYVATGGLDGSPTEFFLLEYGGNITHSRGHTFYHTGYKPTASDVGAVPQVRTINSKPLTADITLSSADVGAAPAGFGLGGYGTGISTVLGDCNLRRQSGFFQGSYIEGLPTSPHSWNYVFNQAHANAAGFFGYLAINFDCSKAWIGGQFGGGQRGPFELVKQGDRLVAHNAIGNDYHQCAIEVNGNTAIDSRPGIGFHMAGRFAGTLHLWEGGDFRFHTQGFASYAGIMTGNVNANDVYIRSDRRLKKNLVEVRDALRKVLSLTAYSYDKKQTLEATEYDKKEVGLIAQDVEQVLPEAVTRVVDSSNKDGTEILTLSNSALIALLVEAVKELSEKVKELEHGRT